MSAIRSGKRPDVASRDPEAALQRLAAEQHGVVSRRQLIGAGVAPHLIDQRVRTGRLTVLCRGVYRVGVVAAALEREMAALLAVGSSAFLCRRRAAEVWKMVAAVPTSVLDVAGATWSRRPAPGVRAHRVLDIHEGELTTFEGLRITTPARTLLDIAGLLPARELEQALAGVLRGNMATRGELSRLLERHRRAPGTRRLRELLEAEVEPALTFSEAEEAFLSLVRDARGPAVDVNVKVCGFMVDFRFRAQRLIVEIDGFRFHSTRTSFESDRRRDVLLQNAGYGILRFTWRDVTEHAGYVLLHLGMALGAAARRS